MVRCGEYAVFIGLDIFGRKKVRVLRINCISCMRQ